MAEWTSFEVCAGGGGQSLGLEAAGFDPLGLVELDPDAVATLRTNRPSWPVWRADLRTFRLQGLVGRVDLLAAGVPCPPFSIAGRQLGPADDRDLFPALLDLALGLRPRSMVVENVCGLASARFSGYLANLCERISRDLRLAVSCRVLRAADFGLAQLRPRLVLVAMEPDAMSRFVWPLGAGSSASVGETLFDIMSSAGWPHAMAWRDHTRGVGPTVVGGSRRHGGPDLGPVRARERWRQLGVDGRSLAERPPSESDPHFLEAQVRLTLPMVSRLQGFPDEWRFNGSKTSRYRQMGNAFPPPVAAAVGRAVGKALAAG